MVKDNEFHSNGCSDSVDKIFCYIQSIVKGEVKIGNFTFKEKKIEVSPLILREIECIRHCGACCSTTFTLDYLPDEDKLENCIEREAYGKKVWTVYPDKGQKGCKYLSKENGDCLVHTCRPFTCDFEMLRFKQYVHENKVLIGTFPFGRCWALTQYNGTKGGICKKKGYSKEYKEDVIRKLYRLKDWIDYYEVPTYIQELIDYVKTLDSCEGKVYWLNQPIDKSKLFSL